MPRIRFTKTLIRTLSKSNLSARHYLHRRHRKKAPEADCTELSKFCSKITDYNWRSRNSRSEGSSKIICSDMESGSNLKASLGYIEDTVNDSDIIQSSASRPFSHRSNTVQFSEDMCLDSHQSLSKRGISRLSGSGKSSKKTDGPPSLRQSSSWQSSGSAGKKRNSGKRSSPDIKLLRQNSPRSPTSEYNYESSPRKGHNHAPVISSLFSQNCLGQSRSRNNFFSRQVSAVIGEQPKMIKKSRTTENSRALVSPKMVIKIRPPQAHELDNVNIHEMIQNRNIFDSKIPSVRSNLDNMLRNKRYLKLAGSRKQHKNSEMQSIREHSRSRKRSKEAPSQRAKSESCKSRPGNYTATSMSQFEFQNHNDFRDAVDWTSKGEFSRLSRTGNGSELSGVQVMVGPKFSDQKEFMSGVGSLNNLTQYIDFPYLNMSKHASRLSRDFQTQDNLSLFRDDKLQYNLECIPKGTARMSIEKYFSNIKKNPAQDVTSEARLESIQGPYFTGRESDQCLAMPKKGKA